MAFVQITLSEREQWAQNLKGNLKGMIPLAEKLANYYDYLDQDDLDHHLSNLFSAKINGFVWDYFLKMVRKFMCDGDKKDFDSVMRYCRRQYKDNIEFTAAKKEMTITFLMKEYAKSRECW
jgi:hypothetical protein